MTQVKAQIGQSIFEGRFTVLYTELAESAMLLLARRSNLIVVMSIAACHDTASAINTGHAANLFDPESGHLAALPRRSRVALVLRGQAFRAGRTYGKPCVESHIPDQLRMTESVMDMIVLPLERASHTVDLYLVESSGCSGLLGHIGELLGEQRVRLNESIESKNQADGMHRTLEAFNSQAGRPDLYRVIIVTRFDVMFKSSIYKWPTVDFDAFNFFSRCESAFRRHCGGGLTPCSKPENCVHDVMHIMPGGYFTKFRELVGRGGCFNERASKRHMSGHGCYNQTVKAFGVEHVGFVTDWVPRLFVREANAILRMFGS